MGHCLTIDAVTIVNRTGMQRSTGVAGTCSVPCAWLVWTIMCQKIVPVQTIFKDFCSQCVSHCSIRRIYAKVF